MEKEALEFLKAEMHGYTTVQANGSESDIIVIPPGSKLECLERFQDQPNRIHQTVALASTGSLCEYIGRFGNSESTVYLDVENAHFEAVLDHSGASDIDMFPEWSQHRAVFAPKQSLEWDAWSGLHKRAIGQIDLAHFIEDRIGDIVEPAPTEVLQAALEFETNEKMVVGSTHNLDNGSVKFTFTKDNAPSKSVEFPHRIRISIPMHENEPTVTLDVRIRYRVADGGVLMFFVSLVKDPDTLVRDALRRIATTIKETIEGHVYEGQIAKGRPLE